MPEVDTNQTGQEPASQQPGQQPAQEPKKDSNQQTDTQPTQAPAPTQPQPQANIDGNVATIDGKQYILKDSFDAVSEKLKKANDEKKKAEDAQLEEQGKFKELAEQREQENKNLLKKMEKQQKANALLSEAGKNGVVDPQALVQLSDLSKIEVSEDGTINQESVTKLVEEMKEQKAYLFGGNGGNVGASGGAPVNPTSGTIYKRSELRDSEFYQKNREDIKKAMAEGRIEDDITPSK